MPIDTSHRLGSVDQDARGGNSPIKDQFAFQDGIERKTWGSYFEDCGVDAEGKHTWLRYLYCCWYDAVNGQANCFYNAILCPFMLWFHSVRIYLCGCIAVHMKRGFLRFCCFCCRAFDWTCNCCGCLCTWLSWSFLDRQFPPCPASVGLVGGDSAGTGERAQGTDQMDIVWIRASKFSTRQGLKTDGTVTGSCLHGLCSSKLSESDMVLYHDGIQAADIMQGQLGDCWLMAAMACMAEVKGGIDNLFLTKEFDPRGMYRIQLFDGTADGGNGKWRTFTIDDYIPCSKKAWNNGQGEASPKFSKPNGNELWVMLLEKAFAKLCGSYQALEGGSTIWALRAMTGDLCRWYLKEQDGASVRWRRWDFVNLPDPLKNPVCPHCLRPIGRDKRNGTVKETDEILTSDEMFNTLLRYYQRLSVCCASGATRMEGLVSGHAYSIIRVARIKCQGRTGPETHRMVRVRNPWGTGEWKGDWSDNSDLWNQHPEVKSKLLPDGPQDDGAFWMSWEDYCKYWGRVGIADRTRDIHTLQFQYPQADRWCGPTRGCLSGCFGFWCYFEGFRRLYCPKRSSEANVAFDGGGAKTCGCINTAKIKDQL